MKWLSLQYPACPSAGASHQHLLTRLKKSKEMEFWDGRERHASPYGKYRTVPGWSSSSHTYPSKTPATLCPESRPEYQGWMSEPSSWMIPGSRTGGTMRDYVNWTDIAPSSRCPPEILHCPQDLATTYSGQERGLERQRVLLERHREKERLVQRGELASKWQPCSSTLHRKEKEKLSANSFRELEAWANRYYHSLPRQRHLEAGTWNATQNLPECERMSRPSSRLVSPEPNPIPLANTPAPHNQEKCNLNNRLRAQLEAWKAQQLPSYVQAKQSPSRRNTVLSPSFSHPPNYMSPPPYSGPQDTNILQVPGQCTAKASAEPVMEYRVESRPVTSAFPVQRRSEHSFVPLTEGRQHIANPSSDGIPRTLDMTYRETEQARKQQMLLSTLVESLAAKQQAVQKQEAAMQQQSSHQISEKNPMSYLDDALVQQSKPKRRRGGETVFCLVSRMGELAGLSSSPDEPLKSHSLPLLNVPTPGGLEAKQIGERQQVSQEPVKLADEVDSESLISHKVEDVIYERPKGESQDNAADQILTDQEAANKERLRREIQETLLAKHAVKESFQTIKENEDPKTSEPYKVEESADPCISSETPQSPQTTESLVAPHSNQTTVKFPVWKEPRHYCSKGASQKKEDPNPDLSNVGQKEEATDAQPKQTDVRNNINTIKDQSRGLVVIDATCVVVKVEFIFPPEKEHVQYVCSRSSDSYEHSSQSLNLQVQNYDHRNTDTIGVTEKSSVANNLQELHVQIREKDDDDLRNRSPTHVSSDIVLEDPSQIPNEVISENETLKERAERILGITFQNSSNEGHTLDELPQTSETEQDLQNIQEEPGGSSVTEVDDVRNMESQLMGVESSDNLKTPTKEIAQEASVLMTSIEEMLEESEVNLVIALDVTKQENENTSKDDEAMLEDIFATQHTEAESRFNFDTGTTQHLNNSLDGKVNGSPSNGTSGTNDLLSSLLDDCAEKTTQSFHQEGSPREGNPLCETGDVNNTCSTLPDDLVEECCEVLAQEESPSEGILSNDLQNLCPTLIQDLPEDGDSSFEMGDSYDERNDESLGKEGNSRDNETSNAADDLMSLCQLETYMETACEFIGQRDASNLSDKNDDLKNICSLFGNSVEGTIELQFSQEDTHCDEPDDLQNLCPSILGSSLEIPSGIFIQEASSSKEDFPSNPFGKKDPGECHPLDEMDGAGNVHSGFLDEHVENSCQRFGQEHSTEDANKSSKAGDISNVCLFFVGSSVEDLSDQESKPKESSQSIDQDDVSILGLVLHLDSSKPFCKEGGPLEGSLSDEADGTRNPCPIFCKNSEEMESQFVTEQEEQTFGTSDKTDTKQNLFQTLHESSEKDMLELSLQESRTSKGSLLNETEDVNNPCCPDFGCNVGNSFELPDHENINDNGHITFPALYCSTVHEQESTSKSPPESLSPCLSESPQHLNKCCLLASSLFETSCSSSLSEHQPELLSLFSSETDINPLTLPTPDFSDHPQLLESWSQTGNVHSEVWSPTSSTSTKCKKKQYPKSLWDAVNRIRKHTAPDSETEDEENGVELWEQMENTLVEDHLTDNTEVQLQKSTLKEGRIGGIIQSNDDKDYSLDVSIVSDMYMGDGTISEGIPLEEQGHRDEVDRTVDVGQPEDDTLSSSSQDSHDSNDTVIEGEGNEPILETDKEEDGNNEELRQKSVLINKCKGNSSEELDLSSVLEEDDDCQISGFFKDNQ